MSDEIFAKLEWAELLRAVARLTVSIMLGAAIGWEREKRHRSAGLRTHTLITLGCAAFMMLGIEVAERSNGDPSRIVQGVAMGIGFLGAGCILKLPNERRIEGLTTAGGIWTAGAIGVAVGAGWIILACVMTLLTVGVLAALRGHVPSDAPRSSGTVKDLPAQQVAATSDAGERGSDDRAA